MAGDPSRVREAMRAMETHLQGMVVPAEEQLDNVERMIAQAATMVEQAMASLTRQLAQAEDALADCEAQETEDYRPNCSQYYRHCRQIESILSQTAAMGQQFEREVGRYQGAAAGLREVIGHDIPAATHWLRDRERALEKFERDSVGVKAQGKPKASGPKPRAGSNIDAINAFGATAIASGNATLLSAFNSIFEGMGGHGYKYQKARQEYLRSLVDDPLQPRHVRGWIKQELNRIEAVKRAEAAGLQPPGRASSHIKGIPGLDVGHRYPGLDFLENFRLEDVWVNRHRPTIAKRLGIFHLFR